MGANITKKRDDRLASVVASTMNRELERNRRKDEAFDRISKIEQHMLNRRMPPYMHRPPMHRPPMHRPPMHRPPPMRGPPMYRPPMHGPPMGGHPMSGPPMMPPYGQPAGGYRPPPPPPPPYMASYGQQPQTQDKSQFWLNTLL